MPYYVIFSGRKRGIVRSWDECRALVTGFPQNEYKRYHTWNEAQEAFNERGLSPEVWEIPETSNIHPGQQGRARPMPDPATVDRTDGIGNQSNICSAKFFFVVGFITGFVLGRLL